MRKENKSRKQQKRHIKVYAKFYNRARSMPVAFPEIRLSGKWLKDSGFDCGQEIIVHHEKDKIVIAKK